MINVSDKLMSDIRLRQAAAYAFDAEAYIKGIGKSIVTPCDGPFPAPSIYHQPTGFPKYDAAHATSLVAAWSKDHAGAKPAINYTTTNAATALTSANLIQQFYNAVGFNCAVKQVQQGELINDALGGNYQVFSWRQFANIDPDLNYVFWTKAAGPVNFARNYDPKIDAAMDTARQSHDPATRIAAYKSVAARMAIDIPYVWAARDVWVVAAQKGLQNWNNPSDPKFRRGLTMLSGIIWPTEMWLD